MFSQRLQKQNTIEQPRPTIDGSHQQETIHEAENDEGTYDVGPNHIGNEESYESGQVTDEEEKYDEQKKPRDNEYSAAHNAYWNEKAGIWIPKGKSQVTTYIENDNEHVIREQQAFYEDQLD